MTAVFPDPAEFSFYLINPERLMAGPSTVRRSFLYSLLFGRVDVVLSDGAADAHAGLPRSTGGSRSVVYASMVNEGLSARRRRLSGLRRHPSDPRLGDRALAAG